MSQTFLGGRIEIVRADITTLALDAVVNAANATLLGGGGVDGAIHRKAGPRLLAACRELGGCAPGQAKITRGYDLPARFVIHAVGPIWRGGDAREDELLTAAYRNSFALCREHALTTVAFPAISTGAYGFPLDRATRIALGVGSRFLASEPAHERIVYACFSAADTATYERIAEEMLA